MRGFIVEEMEDETTQYRFLFDDEEYVLVYSRSPWRLAPPYIETHYRKAEEDSYSVLNERVWSLEIGQLQKLVPLLEGLTVKKGLENFLP